MGKSRLEAFSDGVIAIILTIMVLEMKVPHSPDFTSLQAILPTFISYVLSFIYIGIYWNNHHHLIHSSKSVNGRILWANLHLLFWLSLIPFVTGWMGENHFAAAPVALYGVILFCSAFAYYILAHSLVAHHGKQSDLAIALGKDFKGKVSIMIYALAVILANFNSTLAFALYILVAVMWLVPDRRIEKVIVKEKS